MSTQTPSVSSATLYQMSPSTFRTSDFLRPYNPSYLALLHKVEAFQWIKMQAATFDSPIFQAALSNLYPLGEDGRRFLHLWLRNQPSYSAAGVDEKFRAACSEKPDPATYGDLAALGFVSDYNLESTPLEDVRAYAVKKQMYTYGLSRDEKGKLILNANLFVRGCLKRIKLCLVGGTDFYAYHQGGFWVQLEELQVSQLLRDILHEAAPYSWKTSYSKEYLAALRLSIPQVKGMNQNRAFLNLKNGMLNTQTMELEAHQPSYFSTIRIPIEYRLGTVCPRFLQFLHEIMEGDQERILLIQEMMGYFLTAETIVQKAFFFYGSGANGKSLLAKIITMLCGEENVANVPLSELSNRFGLQNLPDKTLNIATENEFSEKAFNTSMFKAITGDDTVHIEQKFKKAFSYKLLCKLLVLLNTMPQTKDLSHGYFRRILLIPFNKRFEGAAEDKNLLNKLLVELEGILIFALEGLQRLRANNYVFTESAAVQESVEDYRRDQNPLIEFADEKIRLAPEGRIKRPGLPNVFRDWCIANGHEDWARKDTQVFWSLFRMTMAERGWEYATKKVQGTVYLTGLALNQPPQSPNAENMLRFA